MRRRAWILLVGVMAVGGGFWSFDVWRLRAEWQQARQDLAHGKPASALTRLTRLVRRWPKDGEVLYDLGACELTLGHEDRAAAAWAQIPPNSPFAPRAAMMQARQALKQHRLAVAEGLLREALRADAPLAIEARESLVNIYKIQGRYDEARRLVRDGWTTYPDRVGTLQELARLDTDNPIPIGKVRSTLATAYRAAPDDDRVWLGWAQLALRTGRFEEAGKWLDACLGRRPDDPAVWRLRLDWARASEDESEVRRALAHLPADRVPPGEVLALRAWFALRAGDAERERLALEELVGRDPGALRALERLAELALRAGRRDRAEELRRLKGERERTLDWYVVHIFPEDRLDHAAELARAAEAVGRRFESRCWWELAGERPSSAHEARKELARLERFESPSGPAPADLLAELARVSNGDRPAAADRPAGAPPRFVEDAEAVGLRFTYDNGLSEIRQMPETMGGGVGLLDYDGDGWLDIYVVQGGPLRPRQCCKTVADP